MKKILLFSFAILFSSSSFGQIDTLQGDLYFGLWRYGSLYKQPKEVVKWVDGLAKLENRDSLDGTTKSILRIYDVLKKEDLLYNPYVQLKLDNDSIIRIYFDKRDYSKIKKYKLDALQDEKEKVRITLKGRVIGDGLVYCEDLVFVSKEKGQTYAIPHKFAIEDYR